MIYESLIFLTVLCWGFYKFYRTRNLRILYAIGFALLLQLTREPFFISLDTSSGLIGLFSALFLGVQFLIKKKDKDCYQYIIAFVFLGVVLLVKGRAF